MHLGKLIELYNTKSKHKVYYEFVNIIIYQYCFIKCNKYTTTNVRC